MGDNTTAAFILSLIGGLLMLINGIIIAAFAGFAGAIATMMPAMGAGLVGGIFIAYGLAALVIGIIVFIGSFMLREKKKQKTWGIVVLVLSVVSIIFGGGFIIGAILGLVGGILAIAN